MEEDQNGFGLVVTILAILIQIFFIGVGWQVLKINRTDKINTVNPPLSSPIPTTVQNLYSCKENLTSEINTEITLGKNCFVSVIGTDLEVGVTDFYNEPCPSDAQCVWSGVGILFEYKYRGEVEKGVNLIQAFGYLTKILETDHETYIKFSISKIN